MAGTNITLQEEVGRMLSPAEQDLNIKELDERTNEGWKDLVSALYPIGVPEEFAPEVAPFGTSGLRRELAFNVDDYAFCQAFHINHDVKVGGLCYPHIHWTTDGSDENPIRWEFQISRALGHNQEYFSAETSYFVEAQPNGAWRHMISEVSDEDAITLVEPDELLLLTVRRVSNGATENTDKVFGLTVDLHYESDTDSTINKAPNFYGE